MYVHVPQHVLFMSVAVWVSGVHIPILHDLYTILARVEIEWKKCGKAIHIMLAGEAYTQMALQQQTSLQLCRTTEGANESIPFAEIMRLPTVKRHTPVDRHVLLSENLSRYQPLGSLVRVQIWPLSEW